MPLLPEYGYEHVAYLYNYLLCRYIKYYSFTNTISLNANVVNMTLHISVMLAHNIVEQTIGEL